MIWGSTLNQLCHLVFSHLEYNCVYPILGVWVWTEPAWWVCVCLSAGRPLLCCCGDRLAWLAHAVAGSRLGRSRRAILVVPQHAEWHSWQSEGWESSRAPNTTDWGVAEQTGCSGWQQSAADGGCLCRSCRNESRWCVRAHVSKCSPALFVSSDITEGFSSPPSTGCVCTEAGTPASCQPTSQLAGSPDVSVLAFCLFLFHVAITYVCSQGSLSTHFINGKEHM